MIKIKNFNKKVKDFFKTNLHLAVLVLFVLEFFINIWIVPTRHDGIYFIERMNEMSMLKFIEMRYNTWTSRIILEIITCFILTKPAIFWILLNTIMTTLIGYSIMKIFVNDDNKNLIWMTLCFVLIYPIFTVSSSGWGVGSIVYSWTLASLIFSMIPIKKIYFGENIKKYMYPIYSIALIFACNQEQSCIVAFGIYFIFTILLIIKNKKKINTYLLLQCLLIIISLIFIATCPGNYARKSEEIATYYIDFEMLNFFDKFSLGLTSTVTTLLTKENLVFFVFSLLTSVYIFRKYKNVLYRAFALIPLVSVLVLGIFKNLVCGVYPYFNTFYEMIILDKPMLNAASYLQPINYLSLLLSFAILGSTMLNILLIFKNLKNNLAIVIYVIGVISRVAMGFSPTVFASEERTFIFLEFALLIICILIWKEFQKETDKSPVKARNWLQTFFAVLAVLQYIHTVIFTWVSLI